MPETSRRLPFEQAYQVVFDEIASGRYRPGDRIAIKELSANLHMSTTPLREILSRLAGRNIVEQRRSEGYHLSRLDARDIEDLYDLHLLCVIRALSPEALLSCVDIEADIDPWSMLKAVVDAAGDTVLAWVRQLLDDRLRLVRCWEDQLLGDIATERSALAAALRAREIEPARHQIDLFHRRRQALAPDLSVHIGRSRYLTKI
jgi:hypothetical protein